MNDTTETPKVGFVGAGQMGLPMVGRLAAAGYSPLVLARRPEAAAAIEAQGGTPVSELAALSECDIVITCAFSADQVDLIVLEPSGLLAHLRTGATIVSHTTGGRAATERISAATAAKGIDFLDAPVSGTAKDIANGLLTVMMGGTEQVAERCRPLLATYSSTIRHTGAVGTATALKLLNNALFAANIQLAATAVQLAEAEGVSPEVAMEALEHCSGASAALKYMRIGGGPAPFAVQVLPYLRKDVAAVRVYAEESGVKLGAIDATIATGPLELV